MQVEVKSSSQDSSLGEVPTFTGQPQIPCLVQSISTRERMMYMQRNVTVTHNIYTDQDPGTVLSSRIIDNKTGKHYRVVNTFNMGGQDYAWRTEVVEIRS